MAKLSRDEKLLLDLLAAGQSQSAACRTSGIPESTHFHRRKHDEEYNILIKNAVALGDDYKEARATSGTPLGITGDDRKNDFLVAYSKNGDKRAAAKAANIEYASVILACDSEEPEWDESFATDVRRMEKVLANTIEDKLLKRIVEGNSRDAATHYRWYLEKRFADKYGQKSKVEVDQKLTYGLDPEGALRLVEKIFSLNASEAEFTDVTKLVAQEPKRVLPSREG